jgi:hypothetical protein
MNDMNLYEGAAQKGLVKLKKNLYLAKSTLISRGKYLHFEDPFPQEITITSQKM